MRISKKVNNTAIKNLIVYNEKNKAINIDYHKTQKYTVNVETSQLKESTITNIPSLKYKNWNIEKANNRSAIIHLEPSDLIACRLETSKTQKKA